MSDNFKFSKTAIEWRRNTVLSKLAKGYSQADIAKELKLHPSTISLDVQYLKENVKKELQTHISDRLPYEYNRAVTGINTVLKKTSEILDKAEDTKTKMECLKLQMELYRSVMSLATDGGIIEQAFKKVEGLESNRNDSLIKEEQPKEEFPKEDEEPEPTETEEGTGEQYE